MHPMGVASSSSIARRLVRPGPLLILAFLIGAYFVHRWVEAIGGPEQLIARYGVAAPIVSAVLQAILAAAPFPSELFALASAAAYGFWIGTAVTTVGWTAASMIQYALARRGAADANTEAYVARLPAWLRRLPIEHPLFLIAVRWLPMGFHVVNVLAGARGISIPKHLWTAAVGSLPVAAFWCAAGAGVAVCV